MRIFVTSSKDATIYSGSFQSAKTGSNFLTELNRITEQNTGIDQILEVSAFVNTKKDLVYVARALVEFDLSTLTPSSYTNPTYSLSMKATKVRELPRSFTLDILPVSRSWDMGLGKKQDDPITKDGVSWIWADGSGSIQWNNAGGDFLSVSSSTFTYNQKTIDLEADISDMVQGWNSGSLNNYGLVVRYRNSAETGSLNFGSLAFFSSETHTIYRPKLIVDYNDHSLYTGSKTLINYDPFVAFTNLRKTYKAGNEYRLRLHVREQFPALTFSTGSPTSTANTNYLPNSSSYSVVDNVTEEVIVPFGVNSLISSDITGSYIDLDFTGWEAERWYKILIKSDNGTSEVDIIDKDFTFKLVE